MKTEKQKYLQCMMKALNNSGELSLSVSLFENNVYELLNFITEKNITSLSLSDIFYQADINKVKIFLDGLNGLENLTLFLNDMDVSVEKYLANCLSKQPLKTLKLKVAGVNKINPHYFQQMISNFRLITLILEGPFLLDSLMLEVINHLPKNLKKLALLKGQRNISFNDWFAINIRSFQEKLPFLEELTFELISDFSNSNNTFKAIPEPTAMNWVSHINFCNNRIHVEDMKKLVEWFSKLSSLKSFKVVGVPIQNSSIQQLMSSESALEKLYLHSSSLDEQAMGQLVDHLVDNSILKTLSIRLNNHTSGLNPNSIEMILKSPNIEHLDLFGNYLSDEVAFSLSSALKGNPSLISLNVGSNCFSKEGILVILEAVKNHPTLAFLNLSRIPIERITEVEEHELNNKLVKLLIELIQTKDLIEINLTGNIPEIDSLNAEKLKTEIINSPIMDIRINPAFNKEIKNLLKNKQKSHIEKRTKGIFNTGRGMTLFASAKNVVEENECLEVFPKN